MRYQLPIYPLLCMMAAWLVFEVAGSNVQTLKRSNVRTGLAVLIGVTVVALTAAWAFAFHSIYLRPEPRIAASRWIFQNVPGPINLRIETGSDGTTPYNQPLPFPSGANLQPSMPYQTAFTAARDGVLKEILLPHVAAYPEQVPAQMHLSVLQNPNDTLPLASTFTSSSSDVSTALSQSATFDPPPALAANQTYYLKFEIASPKAGSISAARSACSSTALARPVNRQWMSPSRVLSRFKIPTCFPLSPRWMAHWTRLYWAARSTPTRLQPLCRKLSACTSPTSRTRPPTRRCQKPPSRETLTLPTIRAANSYTLTLDHPLPLKEGETYYLALATDLGVLSLSGSAVSNETDYDYGLPFRVDGYDAFGGLYRGDLTEQVYWDDNTDKLNRFVDTLNQTDYIFIPTNHQYAQITRLPERYPLTTYYYRELMGCPPDAEIIRCYYEAQPGDHKGRLGFDLVAVFETFPKLGNFEINDQYAEEAFTFYDHPKVLIFKKNQNFNVDEVKKSLGTVDLTTAVHLAPRDFKGYSNLMLPAARLAQQRAGGTWSQLFDYNWVWNKYPVLGLLIWYLFIFLLGLAIYPLIRLAMPGLADKGYPLSRALGLVLFGYLAWLGGSFGVPYTRTTIAIIFLLILLLGGWLAWYQRAELRGEWRQKRKYFLMIEGLFLGFFLFDLLIRIGNPDLWHPAKGGERPMDFSYLNAVIKSTSFPPYDPWFAGGYINYYYYGFVLVGTPIKLLGIVPSIAYNFVLPTLFAIVGICAFSIGWNLITGDRGQGTEDTGSSPLSLNPSPLISGLAASAFTLFLGNLGTIQMIYQKLQQMGSMGAFEWDPAISIFERMGWAAQGFAMVLKGTPLAIGYGDWYWNPSRVVPPLGGNEITEFPLFTFIYSDLHAHMIAMPLALLALSWALAVVVGRSHWRNRVTAALGLVVGGLIIGALYPSNLSDMYTYLPVALVALGYVIWRYADAPSFYKRVGLVVGAIAALTALSFVMYQPYRAWYSQVYSALDPWKGPFTPHGVLSHALVAVAVRDRLVDGLGDARMDGLDASLVAEEVKTLSGIDRRVHRPDRDCTALSAIPHEQPEFPGRERRLDRASHRGLGGCADPAPGSAGYQALRTVPDRNGVDHYNRRGIGGGARRHRAAEYHLQVLSAILVPAGRQRRSGPGMDPPSLLPMAARLARLLADRPDPAAGRRGPVYRHRHLRQGPRSLDRRSAAHARLDDLHEVCPVRRLWPADGPERRLPRHPLDAG